MSMFGGYNLVFTPQMGIQLLLAELSKILLKVEISQIYSQSRNSELTRSISLDVF